MSGAARASHTDATPAQLWHGLLRPEVEFTPEFSAELNARMRANKLTFGDRVHCPFLRPFFLTSQDENRVREVAELIAQLGERVVQQALADPALLAQVALTPEEERLVRISPRYNGPARLPVLMPFFFRILCNLPNTTRNRPPAPVTPKL